MRRILLPALSLVAILPAPAAAQSLTICHATGNGSFVALSVGADQLAAHTEHDDDVIPAPAGGCAGAAGQPAPAPTSEVVPTATATPIYGVPEPRAPELPDEEPQGELPEAVAEPDAPAGGARPAVSTPMPVTGGFPETVAGPVGHLADTGAEAWWVALLGCGLLFGGVGLRLRLRGVDV